MAGQVTSISFPATSIGKKVLMAATGVFMFLFVVGHLVGNLQIYLGREAINEYARLLRSLPALLWGTRMVLLFSLLVHVFAALQTTVQSYRGRQTRYHFPQQFRSATVFSRTMRISGVLILLYIGYHIAQLTFGIGHPAFDPEDVYRNVVIAFSDPIVSAVYVVAMLILGMHLIHGVWSVFQTIGLNSSRFTKHIRAASAAVVSLIVLGNISIPAAVLAGVIR